MQGFLVGAGVALAAWHGPGSFWLSWPVPGAGGRGVEMRAVCGPGGLTGGSLDVPGLLLGRVWSRPGWVGLLWPLFWPVWGSAPSRCFARPRSAPRSRPSPPLCL